MSGKWKLAIAATTALAAVPAAVVLAQGSGGDGNPGQSVVPGIAAAPVHPVAAGAPNASAGSGGAGAASPRARLQYFTTHPLSVPPGRSGLKVGPVPKACHPISGYYFIPHTLATRIASEGDSPYLKRQWAFYRNNASGKTIRNVVYGIVCLRGVGVIN